MIQATPLILATLVVLAAACVGPSAEAGRGPASNAPEVATPPAPTPTPLPKRVEESRVICEYVRRSGSNIAVRECREVTDFGDAVGKQGSEGYFRSKPSSPSR